MTLEDRDYRYPIDPGWRRATSRIAGTARLERQWMCSFTDAIGVGVETNAIGFRVDWLGDEPGETWLPTFHQLSWQSEAAQHRVLVDGPRGPEVAASPRFALVEMGHHSCHGWNVPPALYQRRGAVSLTALHADGSRESLGRIDLDSDVAVPAMGALVDITPPGERDAELPPRERARCDPHRLLLLALAAALATLLLRRPGRPTLTG